MIASIDPFHAISISRLAHAMEAQGRDILHLEFGQPRFGAPTAAITAAKRVMDSEPMGYWESQPLKERLCQHYRERYGVTVTPERIVLTCGASPALVLALSCLFAPGQQVALARPGYVAYRNTLKALHLMPHEIGCGPESRFQLTAEAVAAINPAPDGIILASPANPTGTIIAPDKMEAIAALCGDRGIAVISDEIYHGLVWEGEAHSMLEYADEALVVSSFSKYFAMAGWRLGWLVVPPALVDAAYARMGNLFLTPPVMAQHAALAAFDSLDVLDGYGAHYRANRDRLLAALPDMGLARIAPPDGAFYIYADVSHLTDDSMALCTRILEETGVATAPGIDFDPVDGRRFLRFSFAVTPDELEAALGRLIPWFSARARI